MNYQPDSQAIADFLLAHPQFFEEHADLLARITLTSPLGGRTVSLQERQMEVLREKNRGLELRLAELMRIAQENDSITDKMQAWTRDLLRARNDVDLPHVLVNGLQTIFGVPHVTLRLWGVSESYAHTWFAAPVSEDARLFCNGLTQPYCGPNQDFEAASWLDEGAEVCSLAMIALRGAEGGPAFGLLVLGSPDPQRFTSEMATDYLAKMGETASAAVAGLLD
ncbi:MAG TPA: DUF484 family protein [Noviherbaspirillum sp.]|nr:DUF484 family protein [Noviherbaspirillum sp.]